MKKLNNYIIEALKLGKGTRINNDDIFNIDDMLNLFSEVIGVNYKNADKKFIDALNDFCEDCITDINKIEIHTEFNGLKDDYKATVKKHNPKIEIKQCGNSNAEKLLNEFFDNTEDSKPVNFNENHNPLDEFLAINKTSKMFTYSSIEGGFIFVA